MRPILGSAAEFKLMPCEATHKWILFAQIGLEFASIYVDSKRARMQQMKPNRIEKELVNENEAGVNETKMKTKSLDKL